MAEAVKPTRAPTAPAAGTSSSQTGELVEVFSGIQGEGPFVGQRMLFVRLAGCSLGCDYCDTPSSWSAPETVIVEGAGPIEGSSASGRSPNPVDVGALMEMLTPSLDDGLSVVTITGGEPLEQPGFTAALAGTLRAAGLRVLLETNGMHPEALSEAGPALWALSLDAKLPLSHEGLASLGVAAGLAESHGVIVYVKVPVFAKAAACGFEESAELSSLARLCASLGLDLVLQPVTWPGGTVPGDPAPTGAASGVAASGGSSSQAGRQAELLRTISLIHPQTRLLPQVHKLAGWR